jgi:DNA/RNA-binding protein KIN17
MPKAEKGSLKDLGKKIKAKGLQKLKFYCQMCEKQCRDANGFKCHMTSESHLRQMKIFSERAGAFMDRYSKEFEKMYLDTLRMRHSTATVNANNVYQEVIQDKNHVHMNSTIWATLSDFVKYLGKMGKCVVEETERGWYVTYIERDVAKLGREEALHRRQQAEQEAEAVTQQRMEQQRVEAAKALDRAGGALHAEPTNLERPDDDDDGANKKPIQIKLVAGSGSTKSSKAKMKLGSAVFGDDDESEEESAKKISVPENKQKISQPSLLVQGEKKRQAAADSNERSPKKEKNHRNDEARTSKDDDVWIYRNILVRIITKKVAGGKYFRCKAVVETVEDAVAEVTVTDAGDSELLGDILRLEQSDLETVAPKKVDQKVRIVRGQHRGEKARAVDLDKRKYRATLEFKDGTKLYQVDYNDFSLLA